MKLISICNNTSFIISEQYAGTYIEAGDVSGDLNGMGDTHISSNGIFPTLSIKPGVEVLLGSAAKIMN